MKVMKDPNKEIKFGDLKVGSVFSYEDRLYIKADVNGELVGVNLDTGGVLYHNKEDFVYESNAYVVKE